VNGLLTRNEVLRALPAGEVTIVDYIGAGAQGEVYKVRLDAPGPERALKWYFPAFATEAQAKIIERLVTLGFEDQRFLWPEALVVAEQDPGRFGYLMGLRPDAFAGLPDLFKRKAKGVSPRSLIVLCINLAEAFRELHVKGIAYRDINWGNVFFEPITGDILVCDNDNAIFEGVETDVWGTAEFMAPELVRREPGANPNTQTDLHSLAVLLFMILTNHHPFEGALEREIRCFDEAAKAQLYGHPVFIFDPVDTSNRPVHREQDLVDKLWKLLPGALQKLFIRAFTDGIRDPQNGRVREIRWIQVLSAVYDSIVLCSSCQKQNYHDHALYRQVRVTSPCWNCGRALVLPPQMKIGERLLMVNADFKLHPHHLSPAADHNFKTVVGALTAHPTQPGRFGITNCSPQLWEVTKLDGTRELLGPGRTAPLREGLRLRIGRVEAVVGSAL
jgi:DNA-binding helix-hairpin-helix protein with protein kinase domain